MSWFERENQVKKDPLICDGQCGLCSVVDTGCPKPKNCLDFGRPTNFRDARARLDQVILNGLSGNADSNCLEKLNQSGFLDYSRLKHSLLFASDFNVDILVALDHLINTRKKNRNSLCFPDSKVLNLSGVNQFLSDLTVEGVRKTLVCCQSIVDGSLMCGEEAEESLWIPTKELIRRGTEVNHSWKKGAERFKSGDLSFDEGELMQVMLFANTGKISKEINPLLERMI